MTRSERRLLIDSSILGLALTFLVTFLDFAGMLSAPERFFYDFRARRCQRYRPPPTTQLVHIDIDDKSLSELGHWPWPRSRLAELVDEINIAGTKALALDVILLEPNPFELDAAGLPATTQPLTRPTTKPAAIRATTAPADDTTVVQLRLVDNDRMLANALGRFGRAVIPLSLSINAPPNKDRIYLAMMDELSIAPWTNRERLLTKLTNRGFKKDKAEDAIATSYTYARDEGMFQRIGLECGDSILSFEELRKRILPKLDLQIAGSPTLRVLREQLNRFAAVQGLRNFAVRIPQKYPNLIDTREEHATLKVLADAGWTSGFVDFVRPTDGTVRFIPLLANHHGYAFPQFGLALACAMLDVSPQDLIVTRKSITIPCKPTPIVIPVHSQETYRGSYDMFIDIPWFGPPVDSGWERMYDYPNHLQKKQHVPIHFIWEACELRHRMKKNNEEAFDALMWLLINEAGKKQEADLLEMNPPDFSNPEVLLPLIDEALSSLELSTEFYNAQKSEELPPKARIKRDTFFATVATLKQVKENNPKLKENLRVRRQDIRDYLGGKAAIIGWIAVGSIADVIPTSLHSQCPGVVTHGVIFNAIMTNDFWRRPPAWVTPLITALMGLLVTAIVAILPPWKALAATIAVAAGYFVFNGYYVFDKHNLIVGVAGPVTAALVVWAGGTLARFILEAGLRAQVTRSFSMRVDPQLVSFVLERDPKVDGQVKELTVVFTDLAGFTTLSERLKEETVPLLNEYMGLMVPVIRKHKGYLNKFLGDGIMYFFGAPYENPNHAYDAVASVLEMRDVMEGFNKSLTERNLPNLGVRAGISSGDMVVGDAGSKDSHDYTVLGDTVNLGARLEPANKVFGTQFLVNARARDLIGDRVLFRPIGKIQVAGKTEGVMAYEPLALAAKASSGLHDMADMTTEIVTAFMNAHFEGCIAAVDRMEAAFRVSKLTSMYRRFSEKYIREGTPPGFDGQIVLSEK